MTVMLLSRTVAGSCGGTGGAVRPRNRWRRQRSKGAKVRKSSSQVTRSQGRSQDFLRGALFFLKKVDDLFSGPPLKTQATNAADCFTVKIKQIKQSDIVTFLFSVHTITEAKQ